MWNHKIQTSTELLFGIYLTKLNEEAEKDKGEDAIGHRLEAEAPHSSLLAAGESEHDQLSC